MYSLDKLNLYQFLYQRTGIGYSTSKRICLYSGHSLFYNAKKIKDSSHSKSLKQFFINNSKSLDKNIFKFQFSSIDKLIRNKSYLGMRHRYHLPCRGQRTRTNHNTRKLKKKVHSKKK